MTRIALVLALALTAQPAPQKKVTPAAQPAPPPVQQPAPPPANAQPAAPPPGLIPFAPLGESPQGAEQNDGMVDVVFEDGSLRFLCFDSRGWLPDVKRVDVTVGVRGERTVTMELYPGAYPPTKPATQTARLGKLSTLSEVDFQAKLDQAGSGEPAGDLAGK